MAKKEFKGEEIQEKDNLIENNDMVEKEKKEFK